MNYRHGFHAGNFADCFKHALLIDLIACLGRKATPLCILDTHAGAGHYDLQTDAALRTNEAAGGILRLLALPDPGILAPYLDLVQFLGVYPGSPAIARGLLRAEDRLICCERHPEEAALLKRYLSGNRLVEVHERSGWEAMGALLPPKEKRGLVFIDPPFEARTEFSDIIAALRIAHARFAHGVYAVWYPVKQLAGVHGFHADLRAWGLRDVIAVEMLLRDPTGPERLNGCGLLVINPPYRFPEQAASLAQAVLDGIGGAEPGGGVQLIRIADE